jgi:HEPN domain-containing protein
MKKETSNWVFFAERDVLAANTLIDNTALTGEVAFHCQQAIEKYFKAYLVENSVPIQKIHDLMKLYAKVKEIKDWNIDISILEDISEVYVESRYPDDECFLPNGMLPTAEQAKMFLAFTQQIESTFKNLVG